ncbi:hypothetical protein C5F49_03565 [Nitrosopumilus oxyclinae]|uniref:Peptidase n=1 Tax=Nitrosopumilus oxyclinae TaxID=1959104 RepID=A0A7D5QZ53_9ARCH|nr:hypothetical protein [Nitrosopumilus oxyclinae]QLH04496.1 hypothetical protein C5F49_03565 [Nitrosopumilus oxyclinae]
MNSSFLVLLLIFPIFLTPSFATVNDFTTDKTLYHTDDTIVISGNVDYDPELLSIIIQIITPSGTGLAHVDSAIPNTDGSFSKTINAGGPTWSENGQYTIKISYAGNLEKFMEYEKSSEYVPPTTPNIAPNTTPNTKPNPTPTNITPNIDDDHPFTENPKMIILGFPAFDKSPQYYIDRYNAESTYRSWFDSQFPLYDIDEVVGYSPTHIENFPAFDKSPQYYIDRYNAESTYRSWFDSQFPERTIYDILGFYTYIPDWIKLYAQNWAIGGISDTEFMSGLNFMIQNKIIVIQNLENNSLSTDDIPSWFRNTAHWWSTDLISQQEFINSIKYLIQEDIISID